MGGVRVAAAVVDDAPSSSSNNLASTTDRPAAAAPAAPASQSGSFFDLDGDGDTDVFDVFYGFYVLLVNSLHAVDVYFVGFPVFSSAATACAFVALSFQISGVAQLSEGVQTLSDLINANLSIGSLGTFMTMSVVGVLLLNVCVITNGLLSWCARIERKEAITGEGKRRCLGLCERRRSTDDDVRTCYDALGCCVKCCVGNGFAAFMALVVTPLLWMLLVVESFTGVLGAVLTALFYATWQSCNMMVQVSRDALESEFVSGVEQTAAALRRQEEQARQMADLFTTVDEVSGTGGFGEGVEQFLMDAEDSTQALEELCGALEPLHSSTAFIFVAAMCLAFVETVVIVRNHIFFERHWFEKRLTLRNDMLQESLERSKSLEEDRRDADQKQQKEEAEQEEEEEEEEEPQREQEERKQQEKQQDGHAPLEQQQQQQQQHKDVEEVQLGDEKEK